MTGSKSQIHQPVRVPIETDVLWNNNLMAQHNRGYFEASHILALNLVSSPGSGKTTLLERTLVELHKRSIYVIEGDQHTSLDAARILAAGAPAVQVNTGNGCHLDALMVQKAVKELTPSKDSLLFIENVGNLVCPAMFDLGENFRIVIISVTEGEDKPLKYPAMFRDSQVCVLNKIDLLPYLDFQVDIFINHLNRIHPGMTLLQLSAKTGEGFSQWIDWLTSRSPDGSIKSPFII
jgi:hydrogenase nickel incorporation protein HypB